jgi:hypothetical protein
MGDAEVPINAIPYQQDDKLIHAVKVLFRPDERDARYFPHVLHRQK